MKIVSLITALAVGSQVATAELIYLVNSSKGGEVSSGIAYYADGAEPPSQPTDYVDVAHGSNVVWEGHTIKGTFGSGTSFTSNIFADSASKRMNAWAGTGSNGYKNWNCYKTSNPDSNPFLTYQTSGWNVYSIYFCRPQ
ncbi:hypothetical protein G7046_g3189 [Stylonectria norvegica]|nr:hypothetical protein G7046_g3189 [Stylonectria norvegica]